MVDDAGNLEETDETDDATEPAAAVAKRIGRPGDDAFEAGPSSPFNEDGSIRWNAAEAAGRHYEAEENERRYVDRKRWEE